MAHSWAHIPLIIAGLFALIELGLSADWLSKVSFINTGPIGLTLFASIWSLCTLAGHFTFPYLVAAVWTLLSALFWLAAAAALTARRCINVEDYYVVGDGWTDLLYYYPAGISRYCLTSVPRYAGIMAIAWLNVFTFLAAFLCIIWYVMKAKKATWRTGMYGKNYFWKPQEGPIIPEKYAMGQVSPAQMPTSGQGHGHMESSFSAPRPMGA